MSTERTSPIYASWQLIWEGREIEVRLCRSWLGGLSAHLELRCAESLPVTETGYRSRFLPMDHVPLDGKIIAFVTEWLDAAAVRPSWRAFVEASRQGSLF